MEKATATAKPRIVAQKPAPRPVKKTPQPKVEVVSHKDQEHYTDQATTMAAALGFQGDDDWELNGIRVADARSYLRKVLHEAHQAPLNNKTLPTAESVREHLGLDAELLPLIEEQIKLAAATEEAK